MVDCSDFKLSKFNFFVKNNDRTIIIYNYLHKQLCKFPAECHDKIVQILNAVGSGNSFSSSASSVFEELVNRKIILPKEYDEESVSKLKYINEIAQNSLCFIIYPTMACNFRCPYCYQDHENENMSLETARRIVSYVRKNISKYRELYVAWFGGEPLLRVDLIRKMSEEFMDICFKRHRVYNSAITTNGYLLDKDTFEALYNYNVRKFAITVDGMPAVHDKQRITADGKGSFERIITNLLDIKKISRNIKFEINIRSNVSREGLEGLEPYVKYMSERFADDDRFCFSFRPVYNWGGDSIDEFKEHLLDSFSGCKNLYNLLYTFDYPMNYFQHYEEITNSAICYASREYTYAVETDGRLSKCTSANRDAKNYFVGNIDVHGNMILNEDLIAQWATPYKNTTGCSDCFFEASCHSDFCVLDKVINHSESKKCPGGKLHLKEYIRLLDKNNKYYQYIEEVKIKETNDNVL